MGSAYLDSVEGSKEFAELVVTNLETAGKVTSLEADILFDCIDSAEEDALKWDIFDYAETLTLMNPLGLAAWLTGFDDEFYECWSQVLGYDSDVETDVKTFWATFFRLAQEEDIPDEVIESFKLLESGVASNLAKEEEEGYIPAAQAQVEEMKQDAADLLQGVNDNLLTTATFLDKVKAGLPGAIAGAIVGAVVAPTAPAILIGAVLGDALVGFVARKK